MEKVGRLLGVVGIALLVLLVVAVPVFAISNPDSIAIQSVKVFQNIFEDGDFLVFVRYDVNYSADPDEPADETFLVNLYDTDGTTLLYQRPLNYYDLNIVSIYLTPAQASGLTWEGAHVIKVMGNPSVFGGLTEGINLVSRTLESSANYVSGDMDASRGYLGIFCINTARVLQADDDWPTLLTSNDKLNTQGAITFIT